MKLLTMAGRRAWAAGLLAAALLAACGGGGGNPGTCVSGSAETCARPNNPAAPPTPVSPSSSDAFAGICTLEGAKSFTRAYLGEAYLWYSEIRDINAANYTNIGSYFYDLLTRELDNSGQLKDRFSFIVTNADADSLTTGSNLGYGVRWETDSQGRQRVAFVDAGSPALAAGLARGGELVELLTAGSSWFPNAAASIEFVYRSTPGAATRTVTLHSAAVQEDPLPLTQSLTSSGGRRVAYLLFNAHTRGAQDKLIPAVQAAQTAGVQDLVLDLRYNGGGFLYTALTLSSMLASSAADGQVFEQLRYNDKRAAESAASTIRFSGHVQFGETAFPQGTALPRLGLPRVYVLAGGGTCSASESIINSLRGVGVDVIIIGQSTCGKPYGFSRKDNCGLSYFPIEFQGVNAQGFGDYAAGFVPACELPDDFDHALGAPAELLLAAALHHIDSGSCPAQALGPQSQLIKPAPGRPLVRGKLLNPGTP